MNSKLYILFIFLLSLFFTNKSTASHIFGGELLYTHLGGNTYQITLTMYGDCSGNAFPALFSDTPRVTIYRNTQIYGTYSLYENISLRKEVSAVCPAQEPFTTCKNPTNPTPGVTRFVFQRTVNLAPSRFWMIVFDGIMGPTSYAGRSNSITNTPVSSVSPQVMRLEAILNNFNGPNSSAQYTTIPTPYYCINVDQQYNQGASDPDNDRLKFEMIPGKVNGGASINYIPPYSAYSPLASTYFNFNSINGQMSFKPDQTQQSLVVDRVEEYRGDTLVGSTMREMTFIVLPCDNNPPSSSIIENSISSGNLYGNTINICNNGQQLQFSLQTWDAESNNIKISTTGSPAGANISVNNNGSQSPTLDFSWSLKGVKEGYYNLYVSHQDDNCPLTGNQTIAYTIHVIDGITISHDVIKETECAHLQHVRFNFDKGLLPRRISVFNNDNKLIKTYVDTTGTIIDSFDVGSYNIVASADSLPCISDYHFDVINSGTYPFPPGFEHIHHCLYDPVQDITPTTATNGTLKWYTLEGIQLSVPPTYHTDAVRQFAWMVSQQVGVCESEKDTLTVSVHEFPDIKILNTRGTICVGEGVYLLASGGIRYEWEPADLVTYRNDSAISTINTPTTFIVKGYSPYNCPDTDTITYADIEQCCTFSYPNAFTPNGDGTNDGWRPIVYGNVENYLLSVYNRWGERVFISSNPHERWNGIYAGKKADMGTYFYYLRAKCVTGQDEVKSGEFLLIR